MRNTNTALSGIIDGMDQGHCKCPYNGTQSSFSNPISQSLTGFLEHGVGLTIYRTVDTVPKGANLTIYCIMAQIEDWKNRHEGNYPEELFLQIDGGSENANMYLLSMMELLISKRMCKVIYVTRLPTGHTHEDIDACFALIWTAFRHRPCESLQKYKKFIQDALGDTRLKVNVVDVMVVPDYKLFLRNCIDEALSHLHTTIYTQHQWRFEAVKPSKHFPYGAKTTYRAYSSDAVVEFEKLPKASCISKIGQITGLECRKVYCRWYPSCDCDDGARKGIEGYYLLRKLPGEVGMINLPPQAFPDGVTESFRKTMNEVRKIYDCVDDSDIRNDWKKWYAEYCPINDDADQYVER
jgi:hypothetical protein